MLEYLICEFLDKTSQQLTWEICDADRDENSHVYSTLAELEEYRIISRSQKKKSTDYHGTGT